MSSASAPSAYGWAELADAIGAIIRRSAHRFNSRLRRIIQCDRQFDGNFSAAADSFAHEHLPAVVGYDPPTFRRAKPETAPRFASTVKRIKHMLPHLIRDSGAIIGNDDFSHPAAFLQQESHGH